MASGVIPTLLEEMTMSKLTPIILAAIMLASTSLVALDWAELENKNMTEADGRSGPDAKVTDILSPRATSVDAITGEKTNTLDAGEDVQFEVYIENIGDVDIEEMAVSLTVYLAENGQRGMIAKDAAGNDLSWRNGDVVCDDANVCPWSTLASNSTLNYGRYTFAYQGSPITWTPITGDYVIVVTTDALDDADPGNDEAETFVSVTDWTDIIVDLAWDSGKEVESGSDPKAFTLTVETGGSTNWSARSIVLQMDVAGLVSEATDDLGNDIKGVNQITDIGNSAVVETFRHETDENNVTNDSRYVINFTESATWTGYLTPDGSGDSGDYSVTVNLVEYVVYDQLPECESTELANNTNNTDPNATAEDETFIHFCEVAFATDANAATSEATIEGVIQTFHDIGVSDLIINQGYTVDEMNNPTNSPTMPGMREGPLNPDWSSVQATVRHLGSDVSVQYDWKVDFEIQNTVTGVSQTFEANNCTFGEGEPYEHSSLGEDFSGTIPPQASPVGYACVMYNFAPGVYNVSATVSMINIPTEDDGTGTMVDKYSDMSARNDDRAFYEISALNNRPSVSLTIQEDPNSVVMGPDSTITLEADAFDADDMTGESLSYVWTHPAMVAINGTVQPSPCNGIGMQFSTCVLTPDMEEWAGTHVYSVTVSDAFGSSAMDFTDFFVWNHVIATDTTASGISMEYNLTYRGANMFDVSIEDSATSYTQDLTQFGYAGEYSSVAVLDYTPSTTYLASDVHDQEIVMTYDTTSITPTGVFWVSTNGDWAELTSTITEAGSDGTIVIPDPTPSGQVLAQGEIVLMGGVLQVVEVPSAYPTGLTVMAQKGGTISASWTYSGNTLPGDYLKMEICDSSDDCTTTQENTSLVAHSLNGQTETTHGETYTYTLWLCNIAGCNELQYAQPESATADSQVDGGVTAINMGVSNKAGANAWTVTWETSGDVSADPVTGWMVCYSRAEWTVAGDMPTVDCADAGMANSADISHKTLGGTYYFTAVPYDALGNMETAVPGTDIMLVVESDNDCIVTADEDCVEDAVDSTDDSSESGEVPTWTWGVIIGLVVVAFVVGAFILSRGGDGEEGKDWDY